MNKHFPLVAILSIFYLACVSCNTVYEAQSLQYKKYDIANKNGQDIAMVQFLAPYSDSVNKLMNSVIGYAGITLEKKLPEGTLGNFMADAYLIMSREKYSMHIDLALMNSGGIRLNQLPAGPVTIGKIFELMPFDNLLVIQSVSGEVLRQLLDTAASKGGWAVSGMTMEIKDHKAINITVGGKPLNNTAKYVIANSDFIVNGGDNATMLKNIPVLANTYLMRDAIRDYILKLKLEGKSISGQIENRVTNVK